jgi:hypothetical protein
MKQNLEGPLFTIAGIRLKYRERHSGGDFHPSSYIGLVASCSLTFLDFSTLCVSSAEGSIVLDTLFVYLLTTTSQAIATLKGTCAKLAPGLQRLHQNLSSNSQVSCNGPLGQLSPAWSSAEDDGIDRSSQLTYGRQMEFAEVVVNYPNYNSPENPAPRVW